MAFLLQRNFFRTSFRSLPQSKKAFVFKLHLLVETKVIRRTTVGDGYLPENISYLGVTFSRKKEARTLKETAVG